MAHLTINLEWTRRLVHYHEQFRGVSNLNHKVKGRRSSNFWWAQSLAKALRNLQGSLGHSCNAIYKALLRIQREWTRRLVHYHEQFPGLSNLNQWRTGSPKLRLSVQNVMDKGFQKLSRVSKVLVQFIYYGMLNNWLRVNKAPCWLPWAIPSTTNLNQWVEDRPSSDLVFRSNRTKVIPEILKGL